MSPAHGKGKQSEANVYTAGKLTFVLYALPLYLPCAAMIILPIGEWAEDGMHGCDDGVLI